MKTFPVSLADGRKVDARQLATFTFYLKGRQFRFVVTQMDGAALPAVTHRQSGMRVCEVTYSMLSACFNNAKDAGYASLANLVRDKGEDRVHDVISRAESANYPIAR